ncbi:VUT family protein [Candidatus Coxiella mudrowiae]|uniref:VUT family protein n=1 Tax=Candidatus Coxiella mudrowiae TaxID=2054173 RepID=UPI00352C1F0E
MLAFYYTISDIITEVYNYREMRNLIWINPLMLYIFSEILFIVINFTIKNSTQIDIPYYIVFSLFLKHIITYSIATVLSIFLNSYILRKFKLLI